MIRRTLAIALLLATSAIHAATLHTRTVTPGATGPNRLDADVALLAGATPDLRDLRLRDAAGSEVGYLLVEGRPQEARWVDGRILPIASTKTSSGFELDLGAPRTIDRLRIDGITAPFLKPVQLEGSGDRARWTLLADTTLFDLPEEQLKRTEIEIAPGDYRYLRVTWNDRASARVTAVGGASARAYSSPAAAEILRVAMPFGTRSSEPGKSRYRIDLPGPRLPIVAVELEVANGNVFREATITEPRLGASSVTPVVLGTATLRRAERFGAVADAMSIAIQAPSGRQLDLVIDDGNNRPLEIRAIRVRFAPQPWIYFESDGQPLTASYGDARLTAPRYDVEALRRFVTKTGVARATWSAGELASKEPKREQFAPMLGSVLDAAKFRIRRRLPNAPAGLAVLTLDADVFAQSRDLGDVRMIDVHNRQVPYVVEKRDEPLVLPLKIPQLRQEGNRSIYRFDLPYASLPGTARLVIETPARVFTRSVELRAVPDEARGRDEQLLASSMWQSADPELVPPALTFDGVLSGTKAIEVVIDEGDNAPLPLSSARILMPSYALRFPHPGGTLVLLYGNDTVAAPQYDLALLAPRLFGEPAQELSAGAIESRSPVESPNERKFFWIVIGIAAVALLVLLARLLAPLLREKPGALD